MYFYITWQGGVCINTNSIKVYTKEGRKCFI